MNKLFLFILITYSVSIAQNKSTLSKERLYGKVKVLLTTEYNVDEKFGKLIKGETNYAKKYFYNNKGFKVKLIIYGRKGDPFEIKEYHYNSKDELCKYTIQDAWKKKPETEIEKLLDYSYSSYEVLYKYDKNENIIEDNLGIFYSETRFNSGINKYHYDAKNKKIRRALYNKPGKINYAWEFKYDSDDNLIEQLGLSGNGYVDEKTVFNYNSKNDIILKSIYNGEEELVLKSSCEYLEYDNNKNWTKRIVYNNDIPLVIEERDVQYYK